MTAGYQRPKIGDLMSTKLLDYMQKYSYKKVLVCNDTQTGLRAIIAIHSTDLGPATGGLRMWPYASEKEAIFDALRLARGMITPRISPTITATR
jgi:glutamate dehydrogenase/leucine dehydrogenase